VNILIVDKLLVSGVELTDHIRISNAFNNYFCNVGPNLVKDLPESKNSYTDYMGLSTSKTIVVDPVTINELCSVH